MKIMIASDIHGSAYYCKKLLEAYEREQADKLLLLGDLLNHGPRNDLPKEYAPKKVITMLNEKKQEILCVRGNCDTEVDQMVLAFPILAEYCILNLGKRMIFATHGHKFNKETLPMLKEGDILLNGHLSPGGGFSGGAIMGAGLILHVNAYGYKKTQKFFNEKTYKTVTVTALSFYCLAKSYSFFTGANHIPSGIPLGNAGDIISSGLILPLNICVGLVVACTLYAFYTLFKKGGM